MKKINIGAGFEWFYDGWESLDNVPVKYTKTQQHIGKCWDSKLKSNYYDIVFTSHTLEHIPQFRIEKTIYEINRILKIGGTFRLLVPNLRLAASAYLKGDKSFFKISKHYSDDLGIGGSFMRLLISPGSQTIAISREIDEFLGGYAHLYCFDFEIMRVLLQKWGFSNIKECKPGGSKIKEMREFQHVVCNKKKYDMDSSFVKNKKFEKYENFYFSGFDKKWKNQLIIEAVKKKNVDYKESKVFLDFRQVRFDSIVDKIKIKIFNKISLIIDYLIKLIKILKLNKVLKNLFK